jgi:hypothetical protein
MSRNRVLLLELCRATVFPPSVPAYIHSVLLGYQLHVRVHGKLTLANHIHIKLTALQLALPYLHRDVRWVMYDIPGPTSL